LFWTWKVRRGRPGRPLVAREVRDLIRKKCRENPLWGAPRIHGELLKLGIDIAESSVSKYMERSHKRPSHTWRTFLENHAQQLVSIDFFTVPTIRFQVLYVFLVLAHDRCRILHFNITAHPTADWTGQQLREVFPFIQICEVLSAPRSPWQRAYVERGARQLPERVLEITTRVFGEEHPDTLTSMWNLGLSFLEVGEVDTAFRLLTQCLNNRYEVLGDQHPDTLAAAKFLARFEQESDPTNYYNEHRTHAGRQGQPPVTGANANRSLANLSCYKWQKHCRLTG
jgi:hypothetical protein